MIEQREAEKLGISIAKNGKRLERDREALRDKLRELLPELVSSDGHVNVKALQDVVDVANSTSNDQGYELTFAGKGLARAQADSSTNYELKTELEQSKYFDNTSNVVIRGDNLDVLKILYQNYFGKVKMIYIDPPYNTRSDEFVYKDNFRQSDAGLIERFGMNDKTADFLHNVFGTRSHSGWLAFMYPRLKLARQLLREDGVIFISIDDNEQASLKIICNEIFGESNFVGQIVAQTNPRGRQLDKFIAKTFEYILLYAKNTNEAKIIEIPKSERVMRSYSHEDSEGKFRLLELRNRGSSQFNRKTRPNLYYPIYINPSDATVSLDSGEDYTETALPQNTKGEDGCWTWSRDKVVSNYNLLVPRKTTKGTWRIFRKDYVPQNGAKSKEKSLWLDTHINHENGKERVTQLLGGGIFDFPKSTGIVEKCLNISTEIGEIVLDFFAGSGTTGDAVMQLNAEDGGNRKFILVQWDEEIDPKKNAAAYQFCTDNNMAPVISSITLERLNRAGEKIGGGGGGGNFPSDVGYKVYSLVPKPESQDKGGDTLQLELTNQRASILDTLTNMLCATCKPLDTSVECLIEGALYKADDELYVVGKISEDDLAPYRSHKINLDGWAELSLSDFLNLGFHDESKKDNLTVVY